MKNNVSEEKLSSDNKENLTYQILNLPYILQISYQATWDFFLIEFIAAIPRDSQLSISSQQRKADTGKNSICFDKSSA